MTVSLNTKQKQKIQYFAEKLQQIAFRYKFLLSEPEEDYKILVENFKIVAQVKSFVISAH